ncbi:PREDICTED: uncharacterized protein LOC109153529 [Ipomoea nil]|uniref:uncharacterized protein LOC109153529 n=1 Tax=Ipomoea nil TaxID=35883 RepID=UPI00090190C5|nr:PREDICTED: uncharacterized protein LOC109153529 [Ipomoea nil]
MEAMSDSIAQQDVAETEHTTDPVGVVDTEDANPGWLQHINVTIITGLKSCMGVEKNGVLLLIKIIFRVGFYLLKGVRPPITLFLEGCPRHLVCVIFITLLLGSYQSGEVERMGKMFGVHKVYPQW